MISRNVIFSVYDRVKGALPIFFEGLTDSEAKQIAVRSQMTLAMMSSTDLEAAEAILPFSSLNKIGFIFLFQISQFDKTKPNCVASLTYLVPQEQQVFLYNKVPFLKFKAEEIAKAIKQNYLYTGSIDFPKDLQKEISDWRVTEQEATAEIQIIERRVTLSEKKEGGSIEFFLSQIKKNEDRAVGALYRGKPIFVTGGSSVLIDLIVHSLDLFVPHATLRKVGYTNSLIDPFYADIIGINKDLEKNYPGQILIDIDKKQVKNGDPCPYSKEVIKEIRKNPKNADIIIKDSTNKLLKVASLLIDVFSQPEEERENKLLEIQKKYETNLIQIAAEVAAQRNPLIRELLLQTVSNRFLDWMGGF